MNNATNNIIVRSDLRANPAVFLADTETDNTIKMWDGKHGNNNLEEVPLAYYRSTVPMGDEAKLAELVKGYVVNFGLSDKEVFVRQRLIKRSSKPGAAAEQEAPKEQTINMDEFKAKFIRAVEKMFETL